MSTFEHHMIQDAKLPISTQNNKDVEEASPPTYPLHEAEELVVGGSRGQRLIHWFRARRNGRRGCCSRADGSRKSVGARVARAVAFIFAIFVFFGVVHLAVLGMTTRKAYKSLKCVPITPSQIQDHGFSATVPLCHSKRLIVHPSLGGGDSVIRHDENVPKGSANFAVKFSNDTQPDAVYDACVTKVWGATVVGLIPREKAAAAMISSFTISIPSSVYQPSVRFLGSGERKISDKKLQKLIRWWRKHQLKKKKCNKKKQVPSAA